MPREMPQEVPTSQSRPPPRRRARAATSRIAPLVAAGLLALSGCGGPAPAPVVAGVQPPTLPQAAKIKAFDGTYQGRSTLVTGTYPACPLGGPGALLVGDGTLVFSYVPELVFTIPIQTDGTLAGRVGTAFLQGRINGDLLDMVIEYPGCRTEYHTHYVWNRS